MAYMLFADFDSSTRAEQAVSQLQQIGYQDSELLYITDHSSKADLTMLDDTEVPGVTGEGIASGALIGGLVGLLAAAAFNDAGYASAGTLSIGSAFGLTGIGAMLLSGFLVGLVVGIVVALYSTLTRPRDDKRYYSEVLSRGGVILGVPVTPDDEQLVRSILDDEQEGLLDGEPYAGSSDYFAEPATSAARSEDSSSGQRNRVRSAKIK